MLYTGDELTRSLKAGTHYPCSRAVFTSRKRAVLLTRAIAGVLQVENN